MSRTHVVAFVALMAAMACDGGGGSGTADGGVSFIDSGPPDATVEPCNGTRCDGVCVDTASDPMNCGGCGLTCDSPGQICTGDAEACTCPDPFIPASITPSGFDQVRDDIVPGVTVALVPMLSGGKINAFIVGYDDTTPIGEDIVLDGGLTVPNAAAAFDVDQASLSARTAYQVTAGTLRFTSACLAGAQGTLTDATFAEVTQELPPTVVAGGCQFSAATVAFRIGSACPEN
jgi:hypothetical protein